jgi:hypothetical protein
VDRDLEGEAADQRRPVDAADEPFVAVLEEPRQPVPVLTGEGSAVERAVEQGLGDLPVAQRPWGRQEGNSVVPVVELREVLDGGEQLAVGQPEHRFVALDDVVGDGHLAVLPPHDGGPVDGLEPAGPGEAGCRLHAVDAGVLPRVGQQPSDVLGDGRLHVLHETNRHATPGPVEAAL